MKVTKFYTVVLLIFTGCHNSLDTTMRVPYEHSEGQHIRTAKDELDDMTRRSQPTSPTQNLEISITDKSKPNAPYGLAERKTDQLEPNSNLTNVANRLKKAAEQGDAQAQYELGHIYREGLGLPKNPTKAAYWFKKASEKGFAKAQFYLGIVALTDIALGMRLQNVYEEQPDAAARLEKEFKRIEADGRESQRLAYPKIKHLAMEGDAEAQYILSRMYTGMLPDIKDKDKASEWRLKAIENNKKAAEHGSIKAQRILGEIYSFQKNEIEKIKWYKKAADQGDPITQYRLGSHYRFRKKDYAEAIKWLEKAANQGHFQAQHELASYYKEKKDYSKAITWYRQAAQQGDVGAQFRLAQILNSGKWAPVHGDEIKAFHNDAEAIRWYKEAAERGHRGALNELVSTYMYNEAVQDYNEAVKWCAKGLEQWNIDAEMSSAVGREYYMGEFLWQEDYIRHICAVGQEYYWGKHITQDYKKAFKWFEIASKKGDSQAQLMLGGMYERGQGVGQSYENAFKWYKKAAAQQGIRGSSAHYCLGRMYYRGEGTTKSYGAAAEWYTKAAEQGHKLAQYSLANMYYKGEGIVQDYVEAYKWANLAAMRGDDLNIRFRDKLKEEMTKEQIAEGQKKASEFHNKLTTKRK
ncbi:MAG: SEL1-like repeat protein [Planctomycetes bacterium]|nr:SEL1-like repeat protein [Planctomycetota bacterium]